MFGDLLSEIRTYTADRIKNPILAPFTFAWMIANWKPVSILFASNYPIETRIFLIETFHLNTKQLLIYPGLFALAYSLFFPWFNLGIQIIQELAISKSKNRKIESDTAYLTNSMKRAEAQARINRVLANEEITRQQRDEIERLNKELEQTQTEAQESAKGMKREIEEKERKLQEISQNDFNLKKETEAEIEKLRYQFEEEQLRASAEIEQTRKELSKRQNELKNTLSKSIDPLIGNDNNAIIDFVTTTNLRLFYNPTSGSGSSKIMKFSDQGAIIDGKNKNENRWDVRNGRLELFQSDGRIHSRFFYLPESKIFVHTGDADTLSKRGQYIIPDYSDWL